MRTIIAKVEVPDVNCGPCGYCYYGETAARCIIFHDNVSCGGVLPVCIEATVKKCKWTYDEHHNMWDTDCGYGHCFIEGDINVNEYQFCPYCGAEIEG